MDRLSSLTVEYNWITYDNEKLLWLPPEYRTTCDITQDNLVALGDETGNVTVVGIDPSQIPQVDSDSSSGMLEGVSMMGNPFRAPCAACARIGRLENYKWVLADHTLDGNEGQEASGVPLAVAWIQSYEINPEFGTWEEGEKEDSHDKHDNKDICSYTKTYNGYDSEDDGEDDGEDEDGKDGDRYEEDDNESDYEEEDEA